jgi:hypothetical protein
MARNPLADFSGVDLSKDSRKALTALLARETFKPNPSLGGSVMNGLALGLMGLYEGQDQKSSDSVQREIAAALHGGDAAKPLPTSFSSPAEFKNQSPVASALTGDPNRVYTQDELNPIDAKVARPNELAADLKMAPRDMDIAARTTIGEAGGYTPQDRANVADVLLNRAKLAGTSPAVEALKPGQFEPWHSASGRRRMDVPTDSPQYQDAARAVWSAAHNAPTGGATHFYGPQAQAALGRKPPAWDDGTGRDIGPHRFFNHPYGGQQPSQAPVQVAQAQTGDPRIRQLQEWSTEEGYRANPARARAASGALITLGRERMKREAEIRQSLELDAAKDRAKYAPERVQQRAAEAASIEAARDQVKNSPDAVTQRIDEAARLEAAKLEAKRRHEQANPGKIPVESQKYLTLAEEGLSNIKGARPVLEKADWNNADWMAWKLGATRGEFGRAMGNAQAAVENALHIMTGAAAPNEEVRRKAATFLPGALDDEAGVKRKFDRMEGLMKRAAGYAKAGTTVQWRDIDSVINGPSLDDKGGGALDEARAAIAAGAPRDKVIERLRGMGVDAGGL